MSSTYFSFFVNNVLFGLPTSIVVEITKGVEFTRIPAAPPHILGLINLRGQLAVGVSLFKRLHISNFENPAIENSSICIFIEEQNQLIGLFVDKVNEMITVEESDFLSSSADLDQNSTGLILGVYKLPLKLLHVVDQRSILNPNKQLSIQ